MTRDGLPTSQSRWVSLRGLWPALGVFTLTRIVVLLVAATTPYTGRFKPGASSWPTWWSPVELQRWDAGHYQSIAINGYPPDIVDTTAFLPAYPLTARPLTWLMQPDLAMVIVAHVESFLAIAVFFCWARLVAGPTTALIAVLLLSVYPPAMFFSAGYPEGLRILCLALMLYCGTRGWWWRGALPAAIVTATHPTGVAIVAAYCAWGLFERTRAASDSTETLITPLPSHSRSAGNRGPYAFSARLMKFTAIGLIGAGGLVAHAANLWVHYGRPDAFFAAQRTWKANPDDQKLSHALLLRPLLEPSMRPVKYLFRGQFEKLAEPETWNRLLNLLVLCLAAAGLARPGSIPRLTFLLPIFVFLLGYQADPYGGSRLEGISRYQLAALPCFLWLAQWPRLRARPLILATLIGALLLLEVLYVRAYVRWELAS